MLQKTNEHLKTSGDLGIFQGPSTHALYTQNLDERLSFVKSQGWVPESATSDVDIYDDNENTLHLIATESDGTIYSSLRLTPISSIKNSLSFSMLSMNPEVKSSVYDKSREIDAVGGGELWDLTRLIRPVANIPPTREGYEAYAAKTIEVIGAGIAATKPKEVGAPDPLWTFVSDEKTLRFLERIGVVIEPIAGGKLTPTDSYDSYFCITSPRVCLENVYQNPEKYKSTIPHVERGLNGAKWL